MTLTKSRAGAAVGAMLLVLVLATLSQSLLGGKVFSSGDNIFLVPPFSAETPAGFVQPSNYLLTDPVQGFVPDLLQGRSDLSHGVLPLWNPDAGGGRPLFASQVDAFLYPLTWLSFLFPFFSSLGWIAAAKLLLAGWGTYLFARELALRRGPALLAGIAFAFGMFFVVWLEHPQTYVWLCLPWMLLATRRICLRGSLGATALLGLSTGLAWQGGHPESAAFLMAVAAAYAAFELIAERRSGSAHVGPPERRWTGPGWTERTGGRAGLAAAGLVLGVGVGAVVIAPLLELLQQAGSTNRGGAPLGLGALYSFAFPELWGMPNKLFHGAGPVNFNERTAYFGALPVLLAFAALGRRRPREVWFFVGTAIVCAAVTYNIPLVASGIRKLPDANVARLTRFLIILSFAGAILAAYGLQRWLTATARERSRLLLVMLVVALVPPISWLVRYPSVLSHLGSALGQLPAVHFHETSQPVVELASIWRWILICALGLGGLAVMRRRRRAALAVVALVTVLTGADLVTLDRGYHGSLPVARVDPPVPASIRYLRGHQGQQRVITTLGALTPNLGIRYGLRVAEVGIDIPYPLRFDQLWTGLGGISGDLTGMDGASPDAHRLADIFAARYVLTPPGSPLPAWARPVLSTAGGTVGLNPTALPRAWVAYDWRRAGNRGDDLALTLSSQTGALLRQPVIEDARTPPAGRPAGPTPARVVDTSTDVVTIHAVAQRAGYLVLDDSAFPGWEASVDGRPAAWLPANENFRAVPIPGGRHTVVFRYHPSSVLAGAVVSILSILALIALAVAGAVTGRRRRAAAPAADLQATPAPRSEAPSVA